MKRPGKMIINDIARSYAALGPQVQTLLPTFSQYECWRWRNHIMSPAFLLSKSLRAKDLVQLENYFAKERRKGPYEDNFPHFFVPESDFYNLEKIKNVCKKRGWTLHENNSSLNLWRSPLAINLPESFIISMGTYKDLQLRADFFSVLQKNFPTSPAFLSELQKMFSHIATALQVVVIYSRRSKQPCASGLVATKDQASFLFCGSVNKRMRKRGLWRSLVAARQSISRRGDGHLWVTTTQTAKIRNKGQESYNLHLFTASQ